MGRSLMNNQPYTLYRMRNYVLSSIVNGHCDGEEDKSNFPNHKKSVQHTVATLNLLPYKQLILSFPKRITEM